MALAAIAIAAIAAFCIWNGRLERSANRFLRAVAEQRWAEAYGFMSSAERKQLNMSSDQFVRFCTAFAKVAWPVRDHEKIEEMTPYVAANSDVDTSWNQAGTRKFSVTFLRPDNAVDLDAKIEFRHDRSGEWHPDVFPLIFSIGKNIPHGHPVLGLLNGLRACGLQKLETYPFHQKTTIKELESVVATRRGSYLKSDPQPLH